MHLLLALPNASSLPHSRNVVLLVELMALKFSSQQEFCVLFDVCPELTYLPSTHSLESSCLGVDVQFVPGNLATAEGVAEMMAAAGDVDILVDSRFSVRNRDFAVC